MSPRESPVECMLAGTGHGGLQMRGQHRDMREFVEITVGSSYLYDLCPACCQVTPAERGVAPVTWRHSPHAKQREATWVER